MLTGVESRLRALVEAFPEPVSLLAAVRDEQGRIVDFRWEAINTPAAALASVRPEEIVGERMLEQVPQARDAGIFDRYCELVETGEPWEETFHFEGEWARRNRIAGDFAMRTVRFGDGVLAVYRDVTRELAAERAWRESEEHFRVAFENAPVGIALVGLDRRIVRVNESFCATIGRPEAELVGADMLEVTHPDDRAPSAALIARLVAGAEHAARLENRYVRGDGRELPGEVSVAVSRDAAGEPRFLIAQLRDLSERRRYEREHELAVALQRSLLPQHLPSVAGVSFAVRYQPGAPGVEIGGDWYDVIALPRGTVGIAIGDVAGRGVPAASVMAHLRTALRIFARAERTPAAVLDALNRAARQLDAPDMATVVYLVLDPESGAMSWSSAGHPPPLVRDPSGRVRLLDGARSMPIGVAPDVRYEDGTAVLGRGETLLAYTDGLVEQRGVDLDAGIARLEGALGDGPDDLERLCDHVVDVALRGRDAGDDIALIALRRNPPESSLRLRVPATVETPGEVRRALRAWLASVGVHADDAFALLAAASEACANVVEHAYGPADAEFEIEAALAPGEVRVVVRDFGRWRPARPGERGRGRMLMAELMDDVTIDAGERGTEVRMRLRLEGAA